MQKCIIKGKFSEAKEILNPIDNVFVLNTYLQVCTYSADVDDAFGAFEKINALQMKLLTI